MSTQVGEGYIEVEPHFNNNVFSRMSAVAARNMATHFSKNFSTAVNKDIRGAFSRAFSNVDRDVDRDTDVIHRRYKRKVDRDSDAWGRAIGKHLSQGFEGVMSLLPARLESLFTKTGPIIGSVLMVGVAAAVAASLPALGAMISGALFASVGLGATLAAVIVAAIDDPRVKGAFDRLKQNFMQKVIYAAPVQSLGDTLAKNLDKVTNALNRWAPSIQSILKAGEKFMGPMFDSFIKSMDVLLPVMDKLSNSKFMQDLMKVMNAGVVKIFEAFATSFNRFLADPEAMTGATKGLELFFNLIAATIKTIFDLLRVLSKLYARMSADGGAFDKIRAVWKGFRDVINTVVSAVSIAITAVVGALTKAWNAFLKWNDMGAKFSSLWQGSILPAIKAFIGAVVAIVKFVVKVVAVIIYGIWQAILIFWRAVGKALVNNLTGVVNAIFGILKGLFKVLEGVFTFFKGLFTLNWSEMWRGIRMIFIGAWTIIINVAKGVWRLLQAAFNVLMGLLKIIWVAGWNQVKTFFGAIWKGIIALAKVQWNFLVSVGKAIWNGFKNFFMGLWTANKNFWIAVWNAIKNFFVGVWNAIFNFAKRIVSAVVNWIVSRLKITIAFWTGVWNSIKNFFINLWNSIWSFITRILSAIVNWLMTRLRNFLAFWRGVWQTIKNFLASVWNGITSTIRRMWDAVSNWLTGKLNAIKRTWQNIWNGMHNILSGVWRNIQSAVTKGINAVIGIINKGVDLINAVLGKLGISWRIPKLGQVGAISGAGAAALKQSSGATIKGAHHKAAGGRMFGPGSTTSDSIHTMLSKDEYVIRASSARRFGYANLDDINRYGKLQRKGTRGYASGGRVGAANNGLLEQHRNHVHVAMAGPPMSYPQIIAAAKRSGIPFQVGSTYRPGSRAGNGNLDHHSEGRAVDFPGFNQDRLASYFEHLGGVIELIHRSNLRDYAIFGGRASVKGGAMSGLFGFLGKGWNWLLDHMLKPVGNKAQGLFGHGNFNQEFGRGVVKGIFNGVVGKVKKEFDEAQAMMDQGYSGGGTSGGAQRWAGLAAKALAMLHLPGSWLGPLLTLIQRESGGNPRATNWTDINARRGDPSRGLMQTIGATFHANALKGYDKDIYDPLSNILAGLRYIQRRYGSIFRVQQAVGATPHGYDNGGWVGDGIWGNYSGKPEMVLNNAQGAALENGINRLSDSHNITVYVDGVEVAHRAIVEKNNAEIIRTLRAGQK